MFYEDPPVRHYSSNNNVEVSPDNLKRLTTDAKAVIDPDYDAWFKLRVVELIPTYMRRKFTEVIMRKPKPTVAEATVKAEAQATEETKYQYKHSYEKRAIDHLHAVAHKVDYLGNFQVARSHFEMLMRIASGNLN